MDKKAGLNLVVLILIVIAIILLILSFIHVNLFYFIVLIGFYIIAVHYIESSRWDNIDPAFNHLLVLVMFCLVYVQGIKTVLKALFDGLIPAFKTNFAENLFIAILVVLIINLAYIFLKWVSCVMEKKKVC